MKKNDQPPPEESQKTLHENSLTAWAVSDGRAGIQVQAISLIESLDQQPIPLLVKMRKPWRFLPAFLLPLTPWIYARETRQQLTKITTEAGDCPDLVVGCGRQAAVFTALCKRLAQKRKKRLMSIQIQDPRISPALYDWVITPEHDHLRAVNVITTKGGLNRITEQRLKTESQRLPSDKEKFPSPRITVLLGGNSKAYRFERRNLTDLIETLKSWHQQTGCSFMITASRRTPEAIRKELEDSLAPLPHKLWDGTGINPYFAWLEQADAFVVTADSVNMISEAASTGKAVHICPLQGGNDKFNRFHQSMEAAGITRPLSRRFSHWTYAPLAETKAISHKIAQEFIKQKTT